MLPAAKMLGLDDPEQYQMPGLLAKGLGPERVAKFEP
jgi:hypothetical protein